MLANLSSINSHILIYFAKWFRYKRNHVWNEPDSGYRTVKPDCCFLRIRQCCALFLLSTGKFKAAGELELAGPSSIHCGSPKRTGHPNGTPYRKKKKVPLGRKCLFHDSILDEHHYNVMLINSCKSQLLLKGVAPKYSSPSAVSHFQHLFSASLTMLLDHDLQEEPDPAENLTQKRKKKVTIHHTGTKWLVLTGGRWPLSWGRYQDRLNFSFSCDLHSDFYLGPSKDLRGRPLGSCK